MSISRRSHLQGAEEAEGSRPDVVTIEDEDGCTTTWPWPTDATMLGNAGFVEVFEALHDAAKEQEQ